ncbi:XPG domain containing-domain-containing protein [Phyllosticta capitalensis]
MGIQRLLITLQDYGSSVELGTAYAHAAPSGRRLEPQQDTKRHVVIDGPGLAYFAYERAFAARSCSSNAFEATPSYAEVGTVAVDFLSVLEKHGLSIAAIFFDGVLPETKRETRVGRLQSYTNQLATFRAANPQSILVNRANANKIDFGQHRSIPEKLRGLPATPFLVPAVIDYLNDSCFSERVFVVPAEADIFCADLVRSLSQSSPCWLISNDSDLLIHDLGASGSVLRFPDISVSTLPGRSSLKGYAYCPSEVAKTLGLRALPPFGFALQQDPHRSLQQCVKFAKELDESDSLYCEFLNEFEPLSSSYEAQLRAAKQLATADPSNALVTLTSYLRKLDPRISELIHQIGHPLTTASPPSNSSQKEYHMYLPFLIEDSSRASAWRISAPLRRLFYMTLGRFFPPHSCIHEFARRGNRILGDAVGFHDSGSELCQSFRELHSNMVALRTSIGDEASLAASPSLFWQLFAVAYFCNELAEAGEQQQLPTHSQVQRLLTGPPDAGQVGAPVPWDAVHRAAQVQGVLYSLRMLRQVLEVVTAAMQAYPEAQSALDASTNGAIAEVAALLSGMPSASLLFDEINTDEATAAATAATPISGLTVMNAIRCVPNVTEDVDVKKKTKRGKSRKRKLEKGGDAEEVPSRHRGPRAPVDGNKFGFLDMLDDEDGSS